MKMDYVASQDRINGYKRKWYETKTFERIEIGFLIITLVIATIVLFY